MRDRVGQLFAGKYEIVDVLGSGAMMDAYRARDVETDQPVVIKIPHAALIGDPSAYGRYEREAKVGQLVQHPNIQRVLATGNAGGPYMVLEYVEGSPLRNYLFERGVLSPEEVTGIALQIADALECCHAHGVVHRDSNLRTS